ncbi:MAG: AMP-binding protein [Chloroflexota bacterium]
MNTLIELVTEGARRHDRRPALLIRPGFRTRIWRYRDLGEVVPRAARVLADAGLGRGERFIVWAVNRPEWSIGWFAGMYLGAVAVPLDVRHTDDFASKVAGQTGARLVIASRQTEKQARRLGLPVVFIETLPDRARHVEPIEPAAVAPDDLAEIVFTSGTTGEPKGAMISHGGLMLVAQAMAEVLDLGPEERLLSVLPLSHLYEQGLGLITPLVVGASIVYPISRQPAILVRTFRDFRASVLLIVPQGLRLLDNAIERKVDQAGQRRRFERAHTIARRLPRRLRRLLFRSVLTEFGGRLHTIGVGSAPLPPELAQRWEEMGVQVLQGYGMTEMSPVVSFTRRDRNVPGTVGQAIPGVDIRVAPDGELIVRGPGRFAGYWQKPEATAAAIDADGWYHTGDIGELSPDGALTLRGRKKDMLVLPDGQKVYAEDVEEALSQDPRVGGSAVVGWPPGETVKVHAVLVLADGAVGGGGSGGDGQEVARDVVRAANARLGAHQQIRGWTVWPDDDLPRTPTLKVRKQVVLDRLVELERMPVGPATASDDDTPTAATAPAGSDPAAAARQPVPVVHAPLAHPETDDHLGHLRELVAEIAGVPESAVAPTLRLSADLNMDSLNRVELLGLIEEELGVYLDDSDLDPDATVEQVAAMVEERRDSKRETGIYGWPLSPGVRMIGLTFQALVMVPLVHLFYRVRRTGVEHLQGLEGPVLFTPNHCLHSDNAIVLTQLPLGWRWSLSVAAGAESIYGNPVRGFLASVLANAFPLRREGSIRRSLELLGARLDRGFNILIYPEGKLTVGGPIQPFKSGAGLLAVEGATPVVPMKLIIHAMSRFDAPGNPIRGDVEIVFGKPIMFDSDTDPATATEQLEQAVRAL